MTTRITDKNITSTGVAAGTYTNATVAVNAQGQITSASSGSSGSGGPKITTITVTDSSYNNLDDTAVDIAGGYIKIAGSGFASGCLVYLNQTPANSVSFVSSSELRVSVPALAAGTYIVYVINTDGGVAISVPGVTFSASPAWQTASALSDQYDNTAITLNLVAADATSYTLTSGSLPPGLTLNTSTGAITGTVTTVTVDTSYTFTVRATDAQLQDSPRTFTITITVSEAYFRLTTLLLGGEQGNTVIKDSSINNFAITAYNDTRASNFTPYSTAWSNFFDGTDDRISVADAAKIELGSDNFTIECWVYNTAYEGAGSNMIFEKGPFTTAKSYRALINATTIQFQINFSGSGSGSYTSFSATGLTNNLNQWYHIAFVRSAGSFYIFRNGVQVGSTGSISGTTFDSSTPLLIGGAADGNNDYMMNGYISNFRIITGQGLATQTFTPSTQPLTTTTTGWVVSGSEVSLTGTVALLTCHTNRFLDTSTSPVALTVAAGTPVVSSFNPFGITNTGDLGSAYFDGTVDYVTTPTSQTPLALDTANFTVECWVYFSSGQPQTNPCILSSSAASGLANTILLQMGTQPSTQIALWVNNVHLTASATNNNLVFNAWNHIAICRTGGSAYSFFINGIAVNSVASNSTSLTANDWRIGYWFSGAHALLGYIADFRIIKGTALYSSNFTLPTQSLTAIANTQLLTLQYKQPHNNHGFQDSSVNQFLITRNGNASQGTFSPFSQTGWGNYFNGSSYLSAGTTLFNYTTGNASTTTFTIEAFVYLNSYQTPSQIYYSPCIISKGDVYLNLGVNGSGNLIFYHYDGTTRTITGSSVIPLATWTYVAVTVTGGTATIYVNGTSVGSGTWYGIQAAGQNTTSLIGRASTNASSLYFNGYVSNLRVSTVARTITTPTTAYANDGNTALLTAQSNRFVDNSSSPITLTLTGSPTVVAWSPFAPTAVYTPSIHGGSAYFDGTGDYLSSSINAISTNDFTIQYWSYLTSHSGTGGEGGYFQISATSGGLEQGYTNGIMATRGPGGTLVVNITNTSISTNYALPLNQWFYTVITRLSNTVRVYVNNLSVATPTTVSTNLSGTFCAIGGYYNTSFLMTGYLANFRVLIGTGYNDGTLPALPTAPLGSNAETRLLLNFTDAAILDRTGRNVVETVADAKASSQQVKYGTGAISFDGTGDVIAIPDSRLLDFGSSDWTIEFWIYRTVNAQHVILTKRTSNVPAGMPVIYANTSNKIIVEFSSQTTFTPTNTVSLNTWTHVAIVRSGSGSGNVKQYINGTVDPTTVTWTTLTTNSSPMYIGGDSNGNNFTGYIDDLRITQFARYTANFTPPTASHRLK